MSLCSRQVTAAVTAFKADKLTRLAESLAAETLLGSQQQAADDDEPLLEEEKVREAWGMAQNTISEVSTPAVVAAEVGAARLGDGRGTVGCDGETVGARWEKGRGTVGDMVGRIGETVGARWGKGRGTVGEMVGAHWGNGWGEVGEG